MGFKKRPYFGVFDMTDEYINEQQQVADLFYNQKLIPKPIQVKDDVWVAQFSKIIPNTSSQKN